MVYLALNAGLVTQYFASRVTDTSAQFQTAALVALSVWLGFLGVSVFVFSTHHVRWRSLARLGQPKALLSEIALPALYCTITVTYFTLPD